MKAKKILSSVVAVAIAGTMLVGTAVSASAAKEITEAKVLVIEMENSDFDWSDSSIDFVTYKFVGTLSEKGELYTYDVNMKATLLSKNVEWANGYYYLKKGTLYNIANKKSALKNIERVFGHVAATKSGTYYYIGGEKPVKIKTTKTIWDVGVNGDGYVMLFTSPENWDGDGWYWVSPEGYSDYRVNG